MSYVGTVKDNDYWDVDNVEGVIRVSVRFDKDKCESIYNESNLSLLSNDTAGKRPGSRRASSSEEASATEDAAIHAVSKTTASAGTSHGIQTPTLPTSTSENAAAAVDAPKTVISSPSRAALTPDDTDNATQGATRVLTPSLCVAGYSLNTVTIANDDRGLPYPGQSFYVSPNVPQITASGSAVLAVLIAMGAMGGVPMSAMAPRVKSKLKSGISEQDKVHMKTYDLFKNITKNTLSRPFEQCASRKVRPAR